MSDPLSFVPLALAASNGCIDGIECRRLVASGVALLQRAAALVRALDGRRAAIVLPVGPQLLVALAACSGREALVLDPEDHSATLAAALRSREVGAAFTLRSLAGWLPAELPRVFLDDAPSHAEWSHAEATRSVDLALHAGLLLESDPETEGSDEVAIVVDRTASPSDGVRAFTHRLLLTHARATVRAFCMDARSHAFTLASPADVGSLVAGCVAPLLAGGRVSTSEGRDVPGLIARVEREGVTTLVAPPATYAAIAAALRAEWRTLDAPLLQQCVAGNAPIDASLDARWREVSSVSLTPPPLLGDDDRSTPPPGRASA